MGREFTWKGRVFEITETSYKTHPRVPALVVHEKGDWEPWCTLTANVGVVPEEGEYTIKTWSENEELYHYLVETGVLIPTGLEIPTGFCHCAVCRMS